MALKLGTLLTLVGLWLAIPPALAAADPAVDQPEVVMRTSAGDVRIALHPEQAPKTVANFLHYVDDGFYEGLQFHRVVADFVIQGGGFDADRKPRQPGPPVVNESVGGLANTRGTIAMARRQDPDSASAQFYINLADNAFLDAQGDQPGYTVFGRVVSGMEVVERIAATEVTNAGGPFSHVPREPVLILEVRRAEAGADDSAERQPQ